MINLPLDVVLFATRLPSELDVLVVKKEQVLKLPRQTSCC